ncbi:MAG: hypothetical protein SNG96_01390 [Rikenellaceae bacterium]
MKRVVTLLIIIISVSGVKTLAQSINPERTILWSESTDQIQLLETDTLLFRLPSNIESDSYTKATRYYRAEGVKRRGLNYWVLNSLMEQYKGAEREFSVAEDETTLSLHAAHAQYRIGGAFIFNQTFDNQWSIASRFDFKSGRDASIDGLFRNEARSDIVIAREFGMGHYLTFNIDFDYIIRSQHSASTQETFDLTGNNFYNPAWGYYDGEVRSARVNSSFQPNLDIRYQLPLSGGATLSLEGGVDLGELKRGSLGYYNSTNPYPNYYRKLPSAMDYGYIRNYTTAVWQSGDTTYTQIAWDDLVRYNQASPDGDAYYIVESRVERYLDSHFKGMVKHTPFKGVDIEWGVESLFDNSLNYKQLDDLLGAEYHLDMDYLIGDSYNVSNELQNNLLDPNREVVEGDRFGYNYSISTLELAGIIAIRASLERFDFMASARIGSASTLRIGYYEKERFPGSSSYGESQVWNYTPIHTTALLGYSLGAKHYLRGEIKYMQSAPYTYDLFLDIDDANTLSNATPLRTADISLSYRFARNQFALECTLFATASRDGVDMVAHYDDLTSTMCRAQTTGIDTNSFGVEVVMDWDITDNWSWISTFTAASYKYASTPEVTLYSDINFSEVASASPALVDGLIVGNAPQITATSSLTYRGFKRYIINLNSSIAAMRYIEPSMIRRTQRVYNHTSNLSSDIVAYSQQERLGDIYDVEVSVIRFFYLRNGDRISARLAVSNLLGDNSRVAWARESSRLQSYDVDGLAISWQGQGSLYQYSSARSIYLTLSYKF